MNDLFPTMISLRDAMVRTAQMDILPLARLATKPTWHTAPAGGACSHADHLPPVFQIDGLAQYAVAEHEILIL